MYPWMSVRNCICEFLNPTTFRAFFQQTRKISVCSKNCSSVRTRLSMLSKRQTFFQLSRSRQWICSGFKFLQKAGLILWEDSWGKINTCRYEKDLMSDSLLLWHEVTRQPAFQTLHFNYLIEQGSGVNQSVPIVLPVTEADKQHLDGLSAITLKYNDRPVAILRKPEFYPHRKEERCSRQFGTTHKGHPYIKVRVEQESINFSVFMLWKLL